MYTYIKERCYFCVCMSLYIKQEHVQAIGEHQGFAPLVPYKTYKGHHDERCIACLSLAPVHQCEHGNGQGAERMLMLLSPCSAAQVMGLEGCVGVHSTSRPPQINLCFPVFLVNLRYLIKEVLWLNQRRVKSVSVCIARSMG